MTVRSWFLALFVFFWMSTSGAQAQEVAPEKQVAAAVAAVPEPMRAGATVLGYDTEGELVELRAGTNAFVCLADDPTDERFHVACYHESLEPFMARGRALRASGLSRSEVQATRKAEIEAGELEMPSHPAALYSLTGPPGSFDPETETVSGADPLYVVYIPYATETSTGLSPRPVAPGAPWLMDAGTPWAHIMVSPPASSSDEE